MVSYVKIPKSRDLVMIEAHPVNFDLCYIMINFSIMFVVYLSLFCLWSSPFVEVKVAVKWKLFKIEAIFRPQTQFILHKHTVVLRKVNRIPLVYCLMRCYSRLLHGS